MSLWIVWYLVTMEIWGKELFLFGADEWILSIIPIAFVGYNLYSKKVAECICRNGIFVLAYTLGCFLSGKLYITLSPHTSDEHIAIYSVSFDYAIYAIVVATVGILIKGIVNVIKAKKGNG